MKNIRKIASLTLLAALVGVSMIAESNSKEQDFYSEYKITRLRDGKTASPIGKNKALDIFTMYPSWMGCGKNQASTDQFSFTCSGCTLTFTLSPGTTEDGGHNSSSHSGTRPVGQLSHATGVPHSVSGSLNLTYQAPDTAGEVTLNVLWQTPGQPNISQDITIYAYVPGLINVDGNSSLITFNNITSHPDDGTYMEEDAADALLAALAAYKYESTNTAGVPAGNVVIPNSEGLSLLYGGLFDINKNYTNPHCNHRTGADADIGMALYKASAYKDDLLFVLQEVLEAFEYEFPVTSEGPSATPAQQAASGFHWHANYKP